MIKKIRKKICEPQDDFEDEYTHKDFILYKPLNNSSGNFDTLVPTNELYGKQNKELILTSIYFVNSFLVIY